MNLSSIKGFLFGVLFYIIATLFFNLIGVTNLFVKALFLIGLIVATYGIDRIYRSNKKR